MTTQRASDLSPAQMFFIELTTLSTVTQLESSSELIGLIFSEALRWCDLNTAPDSWQRKRIYALLSPMYLEVMMEAQSRINQCIAEQPVELLLARTQWTHEEYGPLERSPVYASLTPELQGSMRDAARGVIELAREIILE